jgi:hypothetical protein
MKTKEKNTKTPVTANNQMYTCVGKEEIWLNAVRSRKECLEKLIAKKEDALRHAPEGHLRIHDKKSYSQYYWIKDSGDTRGFFIKRKTIIRRENWHRRIMIKGSLSMQKRK